jgi:hypothetical protein
MIRSLWSARPAAASSYTRCAISSLRLWPEIPAQPSELVALVAVTAQASLLSASLERRACKGTDCTGS